MHVIYLLIDVIVIASLLVLGISVLTQNRRLAINRNFALFVASVAIWIIANYISNDTSNAPIVATRANYFVFAFSYAAVVFLLRFAIELADNKSAKRTFKIASPVLLLVGILAFTPLVVSGVELQQPVYAVTFGIMLPVYALGLINVIVSILYVTRHGMHHANQLQKARLNVLFKSFIISIPLLLLAQFILPALTGWFGLTNVGILPMLIMVFGLYYGVLKHKLFDLRLIVARSIAYLLSLVFIGGIFAVTAFTITHILLRSVSLNTAAMQGLYTVLALAIGVSYSPAKRFFDRITNKLFYRDAFDAQVFLDQFNKLLVSTYDLNPLLRKSAHIIEENLKPTYSLFGIRETESTKRKMVGTVNSPKFSDEDIAFVRAITPRMKRKIIVVDTLEPKYADLQRVLQANNIAIIARLSATHLNEEGIGYLVLGPKKSGNMYSSQDVKMLEILANELVIAIQNALRFEEIASFNLTLQEKVNEATRKLRRTNEKLKALDEAKDDFVSMASHQLRTPLTSIKGYTSMVLEGDAGKINATQRKLLEQSFWSSQRMVYLIADLLNVSRLKTGKFIIEPVAVNLAEVVEQEIVQLKETAAGRNLTLTYSRPDTFPDLMLDETKTRQVIMNFVDNAIYYTPAGGHIEVRLVETPSSVELRVADDGIGVPKSEQPHLFTKFYRAGNARKARPDGTGLGLFMAKKVVVAEGGAVIFETEEGKGSTFGFSFPKGLKAAPSK